MIAQAVIKEARRRQHRRWIVLGAATLTAVAVATASYLASGGGHGGRVDRATNTAAPADYRMTFALAPSPLTNPAAPLKVKSVSSPSGIYTLSILGAHGAVSYRTTATFADGSS
jgi:hypothetical protein